MIISIRNLLFDFNILKSTSFDIPIISVGNITVGGTGKTPHVEYLISILKNEFKLSTLSRGYKRKTKDFLFASEKSTVDDIGDEPLQMKQKFPDVKVAVDRKRVNGVRKIISRLNDVEVILLDDAYQHRYVKPGLSILLVDYNRLIYQDYMLPAGRLREFSSGKKRADIVIVSKCSLEMGDKEQNKIKTRLNLKPKQKLFFSSIDYGELKPVFDAKRLNLDQIKDYSVVLLSGIANPELLKKQIEKYAKNVILMTFADHHLFSLYDIKKIREFYKNVTVEHKIIITTEKDAIRLKEINNMDSELKSVLYYLPIAVEFFQDGREEFKKEVLSYVRKNRKNS